MFRWYVVNTYSGHEKKVQANLEHRRRSMSQEHAIRRIVVPTEPASLSIVRDPQYQEAAQGGR